MALGKRVRIRREALNMKIDELAKKVGRAFSTIQALEQRDSEKCGYAYDLAKALQTNTYWLTDGKGDPNDSGEFGIRRDTGSPSEPPGGLISEAVNFALLGIDEYREKYPHGMESPGIRVKAFKTLYIAWFNEDMRKQGAIPILELLIAA